MGVRHYLHSLSALARWGGNSRLILNGHDDPFDDLLARIGRIRQSLSRRIHQTLSALAEPRTIAEVTIAVYGEMDGYNTLLVLEKIGAYVEYLYQSNFLEIGNLQELEAGAQPVPVRYQRLREVKEVEILPKESAYVFV
jgi:hypothetical protein